MNSVYRQLTTAMKEYKKYPNYFLSLESISRQLEWAYENHKITADQCDELVEKLTMMQESERMGMRG